MIGEFNLDSKGEYSVNLATILVVSQFRSYMSNSVHLKYLNELSAIV